MLHLYHSNKMEALLQALLQLLEQPLESIFAPETILVQNQGMARWITQGIAERQGIAANLEFPLPATFIWRIFQLQLERVPDSSGFDKDALLWRCMALLPQYSHSEGFDEIASYLSGDDASLKCYQLSRRIADLFDQYLVYRADMIKRWEAGKQQHWQARLWRAMRGESAEPHRAALIEEFRTSLDAQGAAAEMPQRIMLFGLSALPPLYLDVIASLSKHVDVHLFLLNPSLNYWGDIVAEKDLARLRESWRRHGRSDSSDLYAVGNPLLASMGKQARDFLDQMHEYEAVDFDFFENPQQETLLGCVQGDILNLQMRGTEEPAVGAIEPGDSSIQVHSCHSPMREVQVLHDCLLSLFGSITELTPQDVVVMAPDIDQLAPYIEAVFGGAPPQRHIPFSIADQADAAQDPLVETLLGWLELPFDRFEAPTVLSWLELPALQKRFRLDQEAVERIREWVSNSGIRWGVDSEHRLQMGIDEADNSNSWAFGFERLFLGYALSPGSSLYQSIAPFTDIEGGEALWLGELQAFIELLDGWRKELARPANIAQWQRRINLMIDQLFQPDEDEEQILKSVRDALDKLVGHTAAAGFDGELDASVLRQHLISQLGSGSGSRRFLTGRVTFCNMVPMRSIPFRVVCLLGMNDSGYPRMDQPLGFDLIAQHPRKGDRSRREDDRYLFLESILSALARLYISYVGHSQQDNSVKLASVVVSELLDYVQQGYQLADGDLRQHLLTEHPLQPFSPGNFRLGSYAAEWLQRSHAQQPFIDDPIPSGDEFTEVVELSELKAFFTNPARAFLKRLGVGSAEYDEVLEESELFELDNLDAYFLKDAVLSELLNGGDSESCLNLARARGELPHGGFGEINFTQTTGKLGEFSRQIASMQKQRDLPVDIRVDVEGTTIAGRVSALVGGGCFSYRPAKLKAKDQLMLWIDHLALCAAGNGGESSHLAEDKVFKLDVVKQEEAAPKLDELVKLYRKGQGMPLSFYPATSLAYAKRIADEKGESAALSSASYAWEGSQYSRGDGSDPWFEQAMRDRDPLDKQFQQIAQQVFIPMFNVAGKG